MYCETTSVLLFLKWWSTHEFVYILLACHDLNYYNSTIRTLLFLKRQAFVSFAQCHCILPWISVYWLFCWWHFWLWPQSIVSSTQQSRSIVLMYVMLDLQHSILIKDIIMFNLLSLKYHIRCCSKVESP